MNIDTGELRWFQDNEDIPEGFTEIPEEYKEFAGQLLGESKSVFVPKNNSLRREMKKIVKSKKKIANKSKSANRKKSK